MSRGTRCGSVNPPFNEPRLRSEKRWRRAEREPRPGLEKRSTSRRAWSAETSTSWDTRDNRRGRPSSSSRNWRSRTTQTGTARPPAKWAIAESEVITRSSPSITAAASRNAPPWASNCGPRSTTGNRSATPASCSAPSPTCKLTSSTPGTAAKGANSARGIERNRSNAYFEFPCQAIPTRNAPRGRTLFQAATRSAPAFRYGTSAGISWRARPGPYVRDRGSSRPPRPSRLRAARHRRGPEDPVRGPRGGSRGPGRAAGATGRG